MTWMTDWGQGIGKCRLSLMLVEARRGSNYGSVNDIAICFFFFFYALEAHHPPKSQPFPLPQY